MIDTYLSNAFPPAPGAHDDVVGFALAEAVITCRAVENNYESLQKLVNKLIHVVADLQHRVEELEDHGAGSY
jgi:hypothetical protein